MITRLQSTSVAVFLALLLTTTPISNAHAGEGQSTWCSDGTTTGGTEIPILNTIVTIAVEAGGSPPYLHLCYSSTTKGDPGPSVSGGWVGLTLSTPNPGVACVRDTNPTILGIECALRDESTSNIGRTLDVTLWFQTTRVDLVAGVELGTAGPVACLFDTVVYLPTTTIGPVDIGVCA